MIKAKIGRPRSQKAREAVLAATHDLLTELGGGGLSVEAIARRASVGRPTVYRWWPSVADIVLEVVLCRADADIPVPSSDSLRGTLGEFLRRSMRAITDWGGAHLRFLMAHAQRDEGFRGRFRDNFVATRRAVLTSLLSCAVEQSQISREQNLDIILDIVLGAMWYRLLVGHAPVDEAFADELAEVVVRLVQAGTGNAQALPEE
jgi:AcrR family transcriptional regulator